eukprot:TRINITY_DN6508_c0_g1_i1.p1 TRINITY_DN6508_c0_g1~~TRINITY_DN6508_c0_g1_i1.p1  ORF type:complete len:169 (-),score=3.55 TRINITY_DN6508_c0_g1_i1:460-966(-)
MAALQKWVILRSLQLYKSARRLALLQQRNEPLVNTSFAAHFRRQPKYPPIRLFRGVSKDHHSHFFASRGVIIPRRLILGHKNAIDHNHGLTNSIFTSWSRTIDAAEIHSGADDVGQIGADCGVVVEALIDPSRMVYSDDIYHENEVLVKGIVFADKIHSIKYMGGKAG